MFFSLAPLKTPTPILLTLHSSDLDKQTCLASHQSRDKAQIQPLSGHYLNQQRCSISAFGFLSHPCPLITRLLFCLSTPRKATLEPQEIHPSPLGEKFASNKPQVLPASYSTAQKASARTTFLAVSAL